MNDINTLIKDSVDVISLVLVFAFVLFDIRYPQITKELDKPIPPKERIEERRRHRKELVRVLLIASFPLVLGYGILLYLFVPLLSRVVYASRIHLWQFDFLRSAFIVVFIFIFVFFIWSVYLAIRLVYRIKQIRTGDSNQVET